MTDGGAGTPLRPGGRLSTAPDAIPPGALAGRTLVVKVGGSIQDDEPGMRGIARDVGALVGAGARVGVVHGGGKAVSAAMAGAGLQPVFVQGQRYTDARTLRIAERVLALETNALLVALLRAGGCDAVGLHSLGACVLHARRLRLPDAGGAPTVDLGFVGEVSAVDTPVLAALLRAGSVPVIAPVARWDAHGEGEPDRLNVNADLAAGAVAGALRADRLIILSDTPGVLTDPGDPASTAPALGRARIAELKARGVIDRGMLPKVDACLGALAGGAGGAVIADGREDGALLRCALGRPLVATMIGD